MEKVKNKIYHTVRTIPKFNSKIQKCTVVRRGKIDTSNTQMHDRSRSCLGSGTSIKTSFMGPNLIWQ
jgi:hypothetical protein